MKGYITLDGVKVGTFKDFTAHPVTQADVELLLFGRTVEEVITDPVRMSISCKRMETNWGALDKLFEDDMKQIQAYVEGLSGVAKERLAKIFILPNFDKVFRRAKRRRLKQLMREARRAK